MMKYIIILILIAGVLVIIVYNQSEKKPVKIESPQDPIIDAPFEFAAREIELEHMKESQEPKKTTPEWTDEERADVKARTIRLPNGKIWTEPPATPMPLNPQAVAAADKTWNYYLKRMPALKDMKQHQREASKINTKKAMHPDQLNACFEIMVKELHTKLTPFAMSQMMKAKTLNIRMRWSYIGDRARKRERMQRPKTQPNPDVKKPLKALEEF